MRLDRHIRVHPRARHHQLGCDGSSRTGHVSSARPCRLGPDKRVGPSLSPPTGGRCLLRELLRRTQRRCAPHRAVTRRPAPRHSSPVFPLPFQLLCSRSHAAVRRNGVGMVMTRKKKLGVNRRKPKGGRGNRRPTFVLRELHGRGIGSGGADGRGGGRDFTCASEHC